MENDTEKTRTVGVHMKELTVILLSINLLAAGCSFLDENPRDQIPEGEAYGDKTLLYVNTVAAVTGMTGGNAESEGLQGTYRGVYDFNTFSSDEAVIPTRGGDWYDGGFWQSLAMHSWTEDDSALKNTWNYLYKVIILCNKSLETIEDSPLPSEKEKREWCAELRALRAMYYYYLTDMFGRVPLITKSSESIGSVGQSDRSSVAGFIVTELAAAVPYLTEKRSTRPGEQYGHINKAAAYFLLAKTALNCEVYFNDGNEGRRTAGKDIKFVVDGQETDAWKATEAWCGKIRELGYRLDDDFAMPFSVHNEESEENIFTIPMDKNLYTNQFQYHFRSLHYDHGAALGFACENGACATTETLDDFAYGTPDQDSRFSLTFFADTVKNLSGETVTMTDGKPLVYHAREVRLVLNGSRYEKTAGARMYKYAADPTATKDSRLRDNDIVLFRYADVLLMEAEAAIREDPDGGREKAAALIGEVRARAGMPPIEPTLENILSERRRELCWEGWRRQDIIRFGKWTGNTTLFPIPADILSLNHGMSQNPGYRKAD